MLLDRVKSVCNSLFSKKFRYFRYFCGMKIHRIVRIYIEHNSLHFGTGQNFTYSHQRHMLTFSDFLPSLLSEAHDIFCRWQKLRGSVFSHFSYRSTIFRQVFHSAAIRYLYLFYTILIIFVVYNFLPCCQCEFASTYFSFACRWLPTLYPYEK